MRGDQVHFCHTAEVWTQPLTLGLLSTAPPLEWTTTVCPKITTHLTGTHTRALQLTLVYSGCMLTRRHAWSRCWQAQVVAGEPTCREVFDARLHLMFTYLLILYKKRLGSFQCFKCCIQHASFACISLSLWKRWSRGCGQLSPHQHLFSVRVGKLCSEIPITAFGSARPQLLSPVQLSLFDISEARPKSVSDVENALI